MAGATTVSNIQLYKQKWHAGLTESTHLRTAFVTSPELTSTMVSNIFGRSGRNPIQYLTDGMGRKEEINNIEYEWFLDGDDERAIHIIENLEVSVTPGLGHTTMRVVLAERWFFARDILNPDDVSRRYQVQVVNDPEPYGEYWLYTLQLVIPDRFAFMDPALIAAGMKLSKEFSAHSEYDKPSDTTFSMPFKMRNIMTTLFKSYTVTRSAATDVMIINVKDPNSNKQTNLWTRFAEWKYMAQYYRELEYMLWFGQYNRKANGEVTLKSGSNKPIYMGAGIREQIASANKRNYTILTKDIILEFLADLSYNILDEGERHFVAFTGEFGFIEFDNAMKVEASQFRVVDNGKFISGSGQELVLQGQFTQYKGPNGVTLTLKKLPLYDNIVTERQLHYRTGRPLSSYRFTILDFGRQNGVSNISKVYKKSSEQIMWHVAGSIDPMGNPATSIGTERGSGKDGYSVFCLSECGIKINNPLSCGELICTAAA